MWRYNGLTTKKKLKPRIDIKNVSKEEFRYGDSAQYERILDIILKSN